MLAAIRHTAPVSYETFARRHYRARPNHTSGPRLAAEWPKRCGLRLGSRSPRRRKLDGKELGVRLRNIGNVPGNARDWLSRQRIGERRTTFSIWRKPGPNLHCLRLALFEE